MNSETNTPCPFCLPESEKIFIRKDLCRCWWDDYPLSPGHALVIPTRHIETWFEATDKEKAEIIGVIDLVKIAIEREHQPTAYNIGMNSGRDAGQTVPHLHVHVIPRYPSDVADPRGGIRNILPAKARWWEQK